ncbi:uncharacterized protein C2845_PM07G14260 [Panicum miliaceum]|uniref:Uncharacterized protein n=1 Tax=Panicum miliaceum TaxID=4540 RepID=A0A3L6SQ22_PANMI|nr:uncharacterized protein C2845_PM07G14260 [Panicum miliaceum]
MAASGLAVAAAAVAAVLAAAALPLLAAGAYADCYDFCFKDCISKDKSMRDYCSYACDKTCAPDGRALRRPASAAAECQIDCVRGSCHGARAGGKDMVACYGQCYDRCKTGPGLPRPLRAGAGVVRPAALPGSPFHEKQDAVGPAALPGSPFHEKQDAVGPAALPDPDDVSHQAWGTVLP